MDTKKDFAEPPALGKVVDELHDIREKKRELEAEVKLVEKQLAEKERELMELMDGQQTRIAEGKTAKVQIDDAVYPTAENWDAIHKYIHDNKYYHLLERRISVTAFRELVDRGEPVPGVIPFKKRKISLKSL